MKKALLWTFVTLLVMVALVSCDSVIGGLGGAKVEYTPDGRKLVEVKIPTGSADRSLSNTLVSTEVNYVEVVFKDPSGTALYRTDGFKGTTLTVSIPEGTYSNANAVMLVGKRTGDDYTLLGFGVITGLTVDDQHKSVTFTVSAASYLSTTLKAGIGSSFKIDEESGDDKIDEGPFFGKTDKGSTDFGPCFQVPLSTDDIEASLTFTGTGFTNFGGNIKVDGDPKVTFTSFGGTYDTIEPTAYTHEDTDAIGVAGKIGFTFSTGANQGTYMVAFEFPVVGFGLGAAVGNVITWNIRGGTKVGQPDFTADINDSVVLAVLAGPATQLIPITIGGF
jgi:hypothetical protein